MARIVHWQYFVDNEGNPLPYAEVRVYLAGTSNEANIFMDSSAGSATTSSTIDLKTNVHGFVQFWIADEWEESSGYESTQKFKIVWQNIVDSIQEEIDNLCVFTPVLPVDTSDSIKGVPSNKDVNKVISNVQGSKWDSHVDSMLPSGSPHDLEAVEFFDLDTRQHKVVSDKLGYQMFELADTASVTPVDISAARYHHEVVSSWTVSGSLYYADINHNFTNYYPIVRVIKGNDFEIKPENIKAVSPDNTRIWLSQNITVNVVVIG
jgi:hypothetical protein